MSSLQIALSVDALRPFEQGEERSGQVPVARFRRLLPLLLDSGGEVTVRLAFSFDAEKRRMIEGHLNASLSVECQRCLEPMEVDLESNIRVGVVDSEAMAEQLPADLEPVVASERDIDLMAVIEDELIMSLPAFPLHDQDQCEAVTTLERLNSSADESFLEASQERDNPFHVLADLGTSGPSGEDPDR